MEARVPSRRSTAGSLLVVALALQPAPAPLGAAEDPFVLLGDGGEPIAFRLRSHKPHLPVEIDGRARWFLLDSGANVSILDRRLAEELGLELRDPGTGSGVAGGASFGFAFTHAPELRVGPLQVLPHTMAVVARGTDGSNGHRSDGLLGGDVFSRYVVEVDYPARTLRLHRPEEWSYHGRGEVLPLRVDPQEKLHVDAEIVVAAGSALAADLVVDTGDRGTVDLTAPFVAEHALLGAVAPKVLSTVGRGVGGEVVHWVGRVAELRLGGLRWSDVPVGLAPPDARGAFARADRSGVLGGAVLERFRVLFDVPGGRLILEPGPGADEPFAWDASGLFLTAAGEALETIEVLAVDPGSPAAEAGVEEGERLVSIDGAAVSGADLDAVRELLALAGRARPWRRLELVVEGADGRRRLTLEIRPRI